MAIHSSLQKDVIIWRDFLRTLEGLEIKAVNISRLFLNSELFTLCVLKPTLS